MRPTIGVLTPYRLAAVDLHTATHIVKKALSGDLTRDRTVILVTHHISLCLPIAAHLVELSSGAVVRSGSTSELRERGELEKIVEAEDTTEEEGTEASSETEVENEADLSRANGNSDDTGCDKKPQPDAGKLVEEEARAEGRVSIRTYWTYIKAAGIVCWILAFGSMLLMRFITVSTQVRHEPPLGCCYSADPLVVLHGEMG